MSLPGQAATLIGATAAFMFFWFIAVLFGAEYFFAPEPAERRAERAIDDDFPLVGAIHRVKPAEPWAPGI